MPKDTKRRWRNRWRRDEDDDDKRSTRRTYDDAATGQATLAQIEQTIADLRSRERSLQSELEATTGEHSQLIERRLAAYRDLAEVRARHAVSDGVIDEADRLSKRVANLLIARQTTIDELKKRITEREQQRSELIERRQSLGDRIETLETRLDDVAMQAREALAADPSYREALAALETAVNIFDKASDKAEQSAADRDEKGRAYESDPLFMYLWRRHFGLRAYDKTGLVRWLDGKVADLVGYQAARANYAVLNEIPDRLLEHVQRLEQDVQNRQDTVDAREIAEIQSLAGIDLPGQLREARAAQSENQKGLEAVEAALSDAAGELNRYAEGQDAAFAKAVELSAEFLGQERTGRLIEIARLTTTPSDDEIAARIADLDADVMAATKIINGKTLELEQLFERREELVRIAADFRRAHYDDNASVFKGRDVGAVLLEELIRGAITGADYWARTKRRHRRRRRPADAYRRRQKFPPFDDMFGGIGDSAEDWFEDTFDFDIDDFKSGGGF